MKVVLASKAQLNSILKNYPNLETGDLKDINIPFMTIMGFECEIYTLRLVVNDLYAANITHSMMFPSSIESLIEDGLKDVVKGLYLLESLCEKVSGTNNKKEGLLRKKNR